jgi:hypothetical protein
MKDQDRFYAACAIMTGMLSNDTAITIPPPKLAEYAVRFADALIRELNCQNEGEEND